MHTESRPSMTTSARLLLASLLAAGLALLFISQAGVAVAATTASDESTLITSKELQTRIDEAAKEQRAIGVDKIHAQQKAMALSRATGNGCGPAGWKGKVFPDNYGLANFRPACDKHDVCYSSGSRYARATCDTSLRRNLQLACESNPPGTRVYNDCYGVAETYYQGVRKLGKPYYLGDGSNA